MPKLRARLPAYVTLAATLLLSSVACTQETGEFTVAHVPAGADPEIRADLGYPPKRDDWSFELSPAEAGWTYRFTMFEGAEQYLGTELFESLPERFSRIDGVTEVEQEDRESYLIKSTLPAPRLEDKLWDSFGTAASQAFSD